MSEYSGASFKFGPGVGRLGDGAFHAAQQAPPAHEVDPSFTVPPHPGPERGPQPFGFAAEAQQPTTAEPKPLRHTAAENLMARIAQAAANQNIPLEAASGAQSSSETTSNATDSSDQPGTQPASAARLTTSRPTPEAPAQEITATDVGMLRKPAKVQQTVVAEHTLHRSGSFAEFSPLFVDGLRRDLTAIENTITSNLEPGELFKPKLAPSGTKSRLRQLRESQAAKAAEVSTETPEPTEPELVEVAPAASEALDEVQPVASTELVWVKAGETTSSLMPGTRSTRIYIEQVRASAAHQPLRAERRDPATLDPDILARTSANISSDQTDQLGTKATATDAAEATADPSTPTEAIDPYAGSGRRRRAYNASEDVALQPTTPRGKHPKSAPAAQLTGNTSFVNGQGDENSTNTLATPPRRLWTVGKGGGAFAEYTTRPMATQQGPLGPNHTSENATSSMSDTSGPKEGNTLNSGIDMEGLNLTPAHHIAPEARGGKAWTDQVAAAAIDKRPVRVNSTLGTENLARIYRLPGLDGRGTLPASVGNLALATGSDSLGGESKDYPRPTSSEQTTDSNTDASESRPTEQADSSSASRPTPTSPKSEPSNEVGPTEPDLAELGKNVAEGILRGVGRLAYRLSLWTESRDRNKDQ